MIASAQRQRLLPHTHIGPGGWKCPCCAPRVGKFRAAIKRAAAGRERRQWMRDMVREELALLASPELEAQYVDEISDILDACTEDPYEIMERERKEQQRRAERYMQRLGLGTRVWEQRQHRYHRTAQHIFEPAYYVYSEVTEDWGDNFVAPDLYMNTLATIALNRTDETWHIDVFSSGQRETYTLSIWEASLDQAQQYASMLVRFNTAQEN